MTTAIQAAALRVGERLSRERETTRRAHERHAIEAKIMALNVVKANPELIAQLIAEVKADVG